MTILFEIELKREKVCIVISRYVSGDDVVVKC